MIQSHVIGSFLSSNYAPSTDRYYNKSNKYNLTKHSPTSMLFPSILSWALSAKVKWNKVYSSKALRVMTMFMLETEEAPYCSSFENEITEDNQWFGGKKDK